MAAELEQLRRYYEELAKTDRKMIGMAQVLKNAVNLNDSLGGSREISGLPSGKEEIQQVDRETLLRIVQFFVDNPLDDQDGRMEVAGKFNETVGRTIPDNTRLQDLFIPTINDPVSDPEIQDSSKKISPATKSFYNKIINAVKRHCMKSIDSDDVALGQLRELGPTAKINNLTQFSLGIARALFARPS